MGKNLRPTICNAGEKYVIIKKRRRSTARFPLLVLAEKKIFIKRLSTHGAGIGKEERTMAVKQTAGRDALGEFAPKFAELNDDVLFGQVWSREEQLSLRDRSLVTVTALMAQGLVDSSFQYHLMTAKKNGITKTEIAEVITHAAFYAGWPKAWAAFSMAKEVWKDEE